MQRHGATDAAFGSPRGASRCAMPEVLAKLMKISSQIGRKDFFLPETEMEQVIRYMLGINAHDMISINRPQYGGSGLIHRLEWRGLRLTNVSHKPLLIP